MGLEEVVGYSRAKAGCPSCCPGTTTAFQQRDHKRMMKVKHDPQSKAKWKEGGLLSNKSTCCDQSFTCFVCLEKLAPFFKMIYKGRTMPEDGLAYHVCRMVDVVGPGFYMRLTGGVACGRCTLFSPEIYPPAVSFIQGDHDVCGVDLYDYSQRYEREEENNFDGVTFGDQAAVPSTNPKKRASEAVDNSQGGAVGAIDNLRGGGAGMDNSRGEGGPSAGTGILQGGTGVDNSQGAGMDNRRCAGMDNSRGAGMDNSRGEGCAGTGMGNSQGSAGMDNSLGASADNLRGSAGAGKKPKKQKRRERRQSTSKLDNVMKERLDNQNIFKKPSSLDGYLWVVGYGLLIPPCVGKRMTHALGGQKEHGLPGIFHAVIDGETAMKVPMDKFYDESTPKVAREIRRYRKAQTLPVDPNDLNGPSRSVTNECVEYAVVEDVLDEKPVKHRHPTVQEILGTVILQPNQLLILPDVLSAFLEPPPPSTADFYLGAMIFLEDKATKASIVGDKMHASMVKRASRGGFEAARRGGSGGTLDINKPQDVKSLKSFLRMPGIVPRKRTACFIEVVNSDSRCGFYILYITPYEDCGRAIAVWYNTPRPGGHQKLLHRQIVENKFLQTFPACRLYTALLCKQLNQASGPATRKIITGAVVNFMKSYYDAVDRAELPVNKNTIKATPMYWLAKLSSHTLVMYPVGGHVDVFSGNSTDVIENKCVFVLKSQCNLQSKLPLGSGGMGEGIFTARVLDW